MSCSSCEGKSKMDKKGKKSAQLPVGAGRAKVKAVISKAVSKQKPSPSKDSKKGK